MGVNRPSGTSRESVDPAPSPQAVAAWLVLGTLRVERVPWWAAQWLVDGHDGQILREVAGLDGRDPLAVTDRLVAALAEIGVPLPASVAAAAAVAFRDLARMCLSGRAGELWVAQQVEEVIRRSDYDAAVPDLPLGRLHGVQDAWEAGWGPSVEELRAMVRAACTEQLAAP